MKIIRFDSVGGASGDMILGALIALGADRDTIVRGLESLLPGHFTLSVEETSSHGIAGVRARVALPETEHHHHCRGEHGQEHGHHHHDHHAFREIRALIEGSALPEPVKRSSVAVFALLAEVEGKIHGKAPEEVSFHEVGAVDSIVDIVGCCYGFHLLGAEAVSVSPLPTGQGTLECAHGVMPIPAPATAELLTRGLEIAPSDEPFELLTPTGAALL
ncbi:MAG TPA: TIGR00299 family protein, partial [Lentisphaeria bacterium]|nr:TIGR00299 family protein [Lentisphaeria bacterium]